MSMHEEMPDENGLAPPAGTPSGPRERPSGPRCLTFRQYDKKENKTMKRRAQKFSIATHLKSPDYGLKVVKTRFPDLKINHKDGHEASNLNKLMTEYKVWAFNMFKGLRFEDIVQDLEKWSGKREIREHLDMMRVQRVRELEGAHPDDDDDDLYTNPVHAAAGQPFNYDSDDDGAGGDSDDEAIRMLLANGAEMSSLARVPRRRPTPAPTPAPAPAPTPAPGAPTLTAPTDDMGADDGFDAALLAALGNAVQDFGAGAGADAGAGAGAGADADLAGDDQEVEFELDEMEDDVDADALEELTGHQYDGVGGSGRAAGGTPGAPSRIV